MCPHAVLTRVERYVHVLLQATALEDALAQHLVSGASFASEGLVLLDNSISSAAQLVVGRSAAFVGDGPPTLGRVMCAFGVARL